MTQFNTDSNVLERTTEKPKIPKKYHVVLHNDDFTPMEFVVNVLVGIFSMPKEKAQAVMLQIHNQGKAIAGTYSHDVASTRVTQVANYAAEFEHPLLCDLQEA